MRNRMSMSLLTKFAVTSFVLIVALGALVGQRLQQGIERRAIASSEEMAGLAIEFVSRSQLIPTTALTPEQLKGMSQALADGDLRARVARLSVLVPDGRIVFADDPARLGTTETSPLLAAALRGKVTSRIAGGKSDGGSGRSTNARYLDVFAPVRPVADGPVVFVVVASLPYGPIVHDIADETRSMALLLAAGLVVLYVALFRLVAAASRRLREQSEQNREQAEENERLALHDTLTELPNRTLLRDRLERALAAAERGNEPLAVLLLDLDRFKEVNDTLGHSYGDGLLRQVASRLATTLRGADTAARLGGDEFALLAVDLADRHDARRVAERVLAALSQPFVVDGITLDIEASIGVAVAPDHGTDADALLRCADVAMYTAKHGKLGVADYDPTQDENTPARLALLGDLRRALDADDQLVLHYQPKVDLALGQLVGVEALVRWQHPERGLVPPGEFVPIAEGTGLIHKLTAYVLDRALRQVRSWLDAGHDVAVAVNVSTRCLLDLGLPDQVRDLLRRYGVPANLLRLEITESTLMADPARALTVLHKLHDLGVRLSLDDFGTGYSSMSYLKRLPIDELKVDRSFVMDMRHERSDAILVRSVVELGHNLGLAVVAEGVEDGDVLSALSDFGCDVAQGYYFARPMPASGLDEWLTGRGAVRRGPWTELGATA